MALASYRSFVPPTWQTMVGGSDAPSRYIVYSDVPGGVFRTQGSALVPVPVAIAFPPQPCFRNGMATVTGSSPINKGETAHGVGWKRLVMGRAVRPTMTDEVAKP